ncbi:MAG: DUF4093 domain-containing protein [Clostridia bacterium]|nr:DUF4093 domain-containing protein [Clostridia bacterium]
MAERLSVALPVVVEGKYDKITLSSVIDAHILQTDGFRLFNNKEKAALFRRLAEKKGIIVLTDSDGGGRQIRAFLSEILPKEKVFHLYIPKQKGKEKRKEKASKAGLLGVEGMEAALLRELFLPFSEDGEWQRPQGVKIDKKDFYAFGLAGRENSAQKRARLARALSFPEDMTANALLAALNLLYTKEEILQILAEQEARGQE